jgi:hypothetical protein
MDFTKFVAMLEEQALYFPNLTSLIDDPLEGFVTRPTVENLYKGLNRTDSEKSEKGCNDVKLTLDLMKLSRYWIYVSSWHMGEHESVAMWKLYLKSGEGVAIQSTVGKLIESLKKVTFNISIEMVKYVDYEKDEIPQCNILSLATHKRKSFEHENELRAIIRDGTYIEGLSVPVDLDVLIEKIFVAPTSPEWIHNLLTKVVTKYGLNKKVEKSILEQGPLY